MRLPDPHDYSRRQCFRKFDAGPNQISGFVAGVRFSTNHTAAEPQNPEI
jgi:hypothetical protein